MNFNIVLHAAQHGLHTCSLLPLPLGLTQLLYILQMFRCVNLF